MSILSFFPDKVQRALEWESFISCEEWFTTKLVLLKGKVKGLYTTYRMPHTKRIFQEVDKYAVNKIVLKTASQTSKTTVLVGAILKKMDTEPNDSMIMLPTATQLPKMYKNKVEPTLMGVESIVKKMELEKEEKKSQSSFAIRISGQILNILSTNDTKSLSIKNAGFDEVVDYPDGKLEEAMERLKSFDGSGEMVMITSTQHPEKDGEDQINHEYNICELQLQYHMCCSNCNELYYPDEKSLNYPNIDEWKQAEKLTDEDVHKYKILSDYATYVRKNTKLKCPHCDYKMNEDQRRKQILEEKCKWVAVEVGSIEENGEIVWRKCKEKKEYSSIGFDINTLCIEGYQMGNISQKIVQASYGKSKITDLRNIYVGYLNKTYKVNIKKTENTDILKLTNGLKRWIVPKEVQRLYLTIDTQKNHFWYTLTGVEHGKKYHMIAEGQAVDVDSLKQLFYAQYSKEGGEGKYIDRVSFDIRGYQESSEENSSRKAYNTTEKIKELIANLNIEARENGWIEDDEHFFYGTLGVSHIDASEKQLSEGYKGVLSKMVTYEDKEDPRRTIKVLKVSNIAAKTELFDAIANGIDNAIARENSEEETYLENIWHINDSIREEWEATEKHKVTDYPMMITAEVYGYEVKNGKKKSYKTFYPIRKRNDYIDTATDAIAWASEDNMGIPTVFEPLIPIDEIDEADIHIDDDYI